VHEQVSKDGGRRLGSSCLLRTLGTGNSACLYSADRNVQQETAHPGSSRRACSPKPEPLCTLQWSSDPGPARWCWCPWVWASHSCHYALPLHLSPRPTPLSTWLHWECLAPGGGDSWVWELGTLRGRWRTEGADCVQAAVMGR
jgi:hypothetical protein